MAKEEPHWGEETRLPFSGTLPLGKAGLLLLCCALEGEGLLSLWALGFDGLRSSSLVLSRIKWPRWSPLNRQLKTCCGG